MSEVENLNTIEFLDRYPFKHMIATIGNLPTSFVDSMSYYECLAWLIKYLETTIIPTVNNNAEAVEELQGKYRELVQFVDGKFDELTTLYNQLKEYVDTYFDNLDVQEEINNKLDEMAGDGTLERLINEHFNVQIIYCKQKGNVQSGDATLIKAFGKSVLIDTHLATLKDTIEEFLDRNGIESLDYVILTHYHADHTGNVKNLVDDGYINTNTTVYMPGYTHLISDDTSLTAAYQEVNNALIGANITRINPTEETTLNIEQVTFKFYNCTETIFDVEEQYTSYNDCSTVVELDYGDRKALFTADIEIKPFERFERLNMFPYKLDFYDIEHHGINYSGSQILNFIGRITPDIAVQSAELGDFVGGAIGQGHTPIYLRSVGCKLYSTYNNSQDIIFEMSQKEVLCKQGIENYSSSNRRPLIPIYVDIATTSVNRDGSQQHPYKDLQEALSRIPQNEHLAFEIHLADGTYESNSNSAVLGKISGSVQVTITGNSTHPENVIIDNSCQIYNGAFVKYQYVTFTKQIAYVENSDLEVNHCNGAHAAATSEPYIYGGGGSNIRVLNSEFSGNGNGQMVSGHGDNIYAYNNSFSTFNICFQNQCSGSTVVVENTFSNVTTQKYLYNGAIDLSLPIPRFDLLWSGEVTTLNEDLNLSKSLTQYNALLVTLGYGGSSPNMATVLITNHQLDNFYHDLNLMGSYNYSSNGQAAGGLLKLAIGSDTTKIRVTQQDAIKVRKIVGVKLTIN